MRTRLAALVAGVALLVGGTAAVVARLRPGGPPARPNVLILLWDTARADRMSLYGAATSTTPRIDAWAQGGVVFEQAVAPDMWTVPAHASLFTGLPSATHGADIDHRALDEVHVTLAEVLGDAGYQTYAFSANPNLARDAGGLLQGFAWVDTSWEDGRWARATAANTRRKLLRQDASTEISPGYPRRLPYGLAYNAAPVAHRAFTEWLDTAADPGRPWLAYLSYMEAHKPRVPTLAARRRVADDDTIARALATDVSLPRQLRYGYGLDDYAPDELAAVRATYDAALVDLDDATADLLDDLAARGVLDDTLVIFTADHGEQLGEHHRMGHRQGLDRALVHVPLVVSWPGRLAPRRVSAPVGTAGLFTTVLGLLDLPAPATPHVRDDWLSEPRPPRVFTETFGWDAASFRRVSALAPGLDPAPFARTWRGVQEGRWWLVASDPVDGGDEEVHLYDALADPAETVDRAGEEPAVVAALRAAWAERAASVPQAERGAPTPPPGVDERRQLELLGYLSAGDEP